MEEENKTQGLHGLDLQSLFLIYNFVLSNANTGFGTIEQEGKVLIREKLMEIEEEIYNRIYGFNPFKKYRKVVSVKGTKPEDVNLDRFVVAKNKEQEVGDQNPKRFVVKKNKSKDQG